MTEPQVSWIPPWYGLTPEQSAMLESRLAVEITRVHPLWGKIAVVMGRRMDQDDILVKLRDGRFAKIHLVWSDSPQAYSAEFPWTTVYESLSDFLASMETHAAEYGNGDTKGDT